MTTANKIVEILRVNAKKAKKLYDLCEKNDEGIYNKLHIIDNSRFPEERKEYRIYHSDGYCFEVSKEKIYLAEDESNDSAICGYEYLFDEGMFEGFKEVTVEKAIELLKQI